MILENIFSFLQRKKTIFIPRTERFIQNFSASIPIAGSSTLFNITIPVKAKFRLLSFGNGCDTFTAWGTIYWEFLLNGSLFSPYERVLDQIGSLAQRQALQKVEIFGGSTFTIRAYNPTAAVCDMGISLEYELEYQE